MIRIVSSSDAGALLTRRTQRLSDAEQVVRPIIEDVRANGDAAVLKYARQFDEFDWPSPLVPEKDLLAAATAMDPALRAAIDTASTNIRAVAQAQLPAEWSEELAPGLRVGQVVRPLDGVCSYIPGGRYPLVSTLLMTVIPAQVAGVSDIFVTTPRPTAEIRGAAGVLDNVRVFLLGGAHAIAAFAFGTETIPRVDRIVGPGNIYVAAAKKLLAGEVGIDFVAGPTEIMIIASEGEAAWIAADMLAQAEHDPEASAFLLTTSRSLGDKVSAEIERQMQGLPTAAVAREAIDRNSAIIAVKSNEEAAELCNQFAPEHVSVENADLVSDIRHAGSIFIGAWSAEAAGDYVCGPNHVLPTAGAARLRGGLSVTDFVKVISTQELTREALAEVAPSIKTMARCEGLEAHARSVEIRLNE